MTDGQILEVLAALNNGEVEQSKVALQRSKTPQVLAFAQQMLTQHAELQSRTMAITESGEITSADSPLAERLAYEAREFAESLRGVDEADVDGLYLGAEAGEHQDVCALVRAQLVPAANAPALKDLVAESLSTFEEHAAEAKRLQQELGLSGGQSGTATP